MKKVSVYDLSDYESCDNCKHSCEIVRDKLLLCRKRGLVAYDSMCRHFELDLLSVNPKKLRNIHSGLSKEDFEI